MERISRHKFGTQVNVTDFFSLTLSAGQERFRALTRGYYRGATGALLCYSVTNRVTFENCETWLDELMQHADPGIIVMLVGNKTDVHSRDVTTEEGMEFAQKNRLQFIETSAKDNSNVSEAFERLIREICKQHINNVSKEETVHPSLPPSNVMPVQISDKPAETPKPGCC
eukprot:TRINITY_DN2011_c0_g1_i4.p1 TRINITY_DN2011_c0_g1~~TRINITY_DN2011_c0_g1_i4.p1  ORF type:complete len:170 (-),score=26.02 TRINITY_DN2011_c0_g1_i4:162-671(-)